MIGRVPLAAMLAILLAFGPIASAWAAAVPCQAPRCHASVMAGMPAAAPPVLPAAAPPVSQSDHPSGHQRPCGIGCPMHDAIAALNAPLPLVRRTSRPQAFGPDAPDAFIAWRPMTDHGPPRPAA